MVTDPYAVLRALLRAEAARTAPKKAAAVLAVENRTDTDIEQLPQREDAKR